MLVVGASSGIGAALARAVAAGGGQVAVSARRSDRLEELVAQMGTGYAVPGDATDPDDARRVADAAAGAMGGLDLMVYVAGYGVLQPLVETDPDTWTDVFRVNVVGANLAAAAAPTTSPRRPSSGLSMGAACQPTRAAPQSGPGHVDQRLEAVSSSTGR